MTDRDIIRAEIERRMNCFKNERNTITKASDNNLSLGARIAMCEEFLSFINSMKEESVSEDLEDAVIQICQKVLKGETIVIDGYEYVVLSDAEECFKAGAQWQKEKTINKACDWIKNKLIDYYDYAETKEFIEDFRKALKED